MFSVIEKILGRISPTIKSINTHNITFEYLQRLFLVNQFASHRLGNLGKMGRGKTWARWEGGQAAIWPDFPTID